MKETIETIVHQFPLVLKWQQPNEPAVVRVINIKQNKKKRLRENQLLAELFCIFIKINQYLVHTVLYFTFDLISVVFLTWKPLLETCCLISTSYLLVLLLINMQN